MITLEGPFDAHVHLRDGALLKSVAAATARQFTRAVIMPNLAPPITTAAAARAYRARVLAAVPDGLSFEPIMTCYLTDTTDPAEVADGHAEGLWRAAKLYPARATTNSHHGVTDMARVTAVLERMAEIGMPLLVHGEVTDPSVDIFDREAVFIETVLAPLVERIPELAIVLEHVTTREGVAFVAGARDGVAATITAHHLMINRNAMFEGGLRPHAYCLPVAKREAHRLALRAAATGASDRFFLGTDSAPHPAHAKEAACGCAGIYSAPVALEAYAQVFEEEGALERLADFACRRGPAFYGLPVGGRAVILRRAGWTPPGRIGVEGGELVPFLAGRELRWRVDPAAASA